MDSKVAARWSKGASADAVVENDDEDGSLDEDESGDDEDADPNGAVWGGTDGRTAVELLEMDDTETAAFCDWLIDREPGITAALLEVASAEPDDADLPQLSEVFMSAEQLEVEDFEPFGASQRTAAVEHVRTLVDGGTDPFLAVGRALAASRATSELGPDELDGEGDGAEGAPRVTHPAPPLV